MFPYELSVADKVSELWKFAKNQLLMLDAWKFQVMFSVILLTCNTKRNFHQAITFREMNF